MPTPARSCRRSTISTIQRARLQSLFDFDYQIECYVPEAKRRYGYFALPLLYKDQLVGRMDCKAFRNQRRLALQSVHLECPKAEITTVCTALAAALPDFAGVPKIAIKSSVHDVWPKPGTQILQKALAKHSFNIRNRLVSAYLMP